MFCALFCISIPTTTFAEKVTKEELSNIALQIKGLKHFLKDSDSAKFRDVFISRYEDGVVACGEVNAKNSYGAYSGFSKFVQTSIVDSDEVWSHFCNNKISSYTVK